MAENLCDLKLGAHIISACKKLQTIKEKKVDKLDLYQNLRYLLFKKTLLSM